MRDGYIKKESKKDNYNETNQKVFNDDKGRRFN
jgi:hypothetical protein